MRQVYASWRAIALGGFVMVFSVMLAAQNPANVSGVVLDQAGKTVANCRAIARVCWVGTAQRISVAEANADTSEVTVSASGRIVSPSPG